MSGKKQYHLVMSEWFRNQVRRSMVSLLLPSVLEAVGNQQDPGLRRDLDALRDEQEQSARLLEAFSEQTRQREAATNRILSEQITQLEARLRSEGGDLRADLLDAIAAQERSWREELSQERQERWRQVAELGTSVENLLEDRAAAEAAARRWLGDAEAERELIAATLPHERYASGAVSRLDKRLDTVRENVEHGRFDAALAVAQETYHELSDLRVDLALRHREWVEMRWQARRALTIVQEIIRHSARLPSSGTDELGAADIDVDYWSGGDLARLRQHVDRTLAELTEAAEPPTIDQLREIVDQQAPDFRRQLDDIMELAQKRVEASQLRVNIAELVAAALEGGFAYRTEYGGYESGDERAAFLARMGSLGGNTVVVQVRPAGDDLTDAELDVLSYDVDTESARRRQERGAAITRLLRGNGLPVPEPRDLGEPEPEELAKLPALPPGAAPSARAAQAATTAPANAARLADPARPADSVS